MHYGQGKSGGGGGGPQPDKKHCGPRTLPKQPVENVQGGDRIQQAANKLAGKK